MGVKTSVGLAYQLTIEPPLASTRFVTRDKQDGLTLGIESKGHTPFAASCGEAQLFHVGMARALERVDARATELRAELLKQAGHGKNLSPHVFVQLLKFRRELVGNLNDLSHYQTMPLIAYSVKGIIRPSRFGITPWSPLRWLRSHIVLVRSQ
jgi:hypothetical protein